MMKQSLNPTQRVMKSTLMKIDPPHDELLVPRSKVPINSVKDDYFPYVLAIDPISKNNITIPDPNTPIVQVNNSSDESLVFSIDNDHLVHHEPILIWSRGKHIKLVNILGKPQAGVTTRSRIRYSKDTSAHEFLYVNFLSEIELKKLVQAREEEEWIIAMQEELNQL
ncbi:hypothetical protein Tco_0736924 [Tanacetum coccineum]